MDNWVAWWSAAHMTFEMLSNDLSSMSSECGKNLQKQRIPCEAYVGCKKISTWGNIAII